MAIDGRGPRGDGGEHPDAERLAEYADGVLTGEVRTQVEAHLAACDDCRTAVMDAVMFAAEDQPVPVAPPAPRVVAFPSRRRWVVGVGAGLAAAAAVLLTVRVWQPDWLGLSPSDRPELDGLVAAASTQPTRLVEGRLSANFPYAPPPSATRSNDDPEATPPDIRIAAAELEKRVTENDTPESRAAAALGYLAVGRVDRAVAELERAVAAAPEQKHFQNDLSAAYLASAQRGAAAQLPRALTAAERALALDAAFPPACFNRALALERLALREQALQAWSRCLTLDAGDGWAAEIRQRIAALSGPQAGPSPLERLRLAARDGDGASAAAAAADAPQTGREYLDAELLPAWGRAAIADDAANAATLLRVAAAIAAQLAERGDRLPARVVDRLRQADGLSRRRLAQAHALYREALMAREVAQIVARARRVETTFRQEASEFWVWPVLQVANSVRLMGDTATAAALLTALQQHASASGYLALDARATWLLGLIHVGHGRFTPALAAYHQARQGFTRIGEAENTAFLDTLLAEALDTLGDEARSWEHRLAAISRQPVRPMLRQPMLLDAAAASADDEMPEAAAHFQQAALDAAVAAGRPDMIIEAHLQRSPLLATLGRHDEAAAGLRDAETQMHRLTDTDIKRRLEAEVHVVAGTLQCERDPAAGLQRLSSAITRFTADGRHRRLASAYLRRARCARKANDPVEAERMLVDGIRLLEQARNELPDAELRSSLVDERFDLYAEAAALNLFDKPVADPLVALAIADRSRLVSTIAFQPEAFDARSLGELLPADTAILYFLMLPDRLVSWTIERGRWTTARLDVSERDLRQRVDDYRRALMGDPRSSRAAGHARHLYEWLLKPALSASRRRLIIVPDGPLHLLPFASLVNPATGRVALDDVVISTVPSADAARRLLMRGHERPRRSVIAFAADGNGHLAALPDAMAEVAAIASFYPDARVVTGNDVTLANVRRAVDADVVHFAGHAIVNPDRPWLSRLVLSPSGGATESDNLFAHEIARWPFRRTQLVVLSACDTGAGRVFRGQGAMSLASPFLTAGVPGVIGTLWKVHDDAARSLAVALHERLAAGAVPAAALRDAQRVVRDASGHTADWAAFVLFGV